MAARVVEMAIDDSSADAAVGRLSNLIEHPELMLKDMGEELLQSTRQRLTEGITPDGEPFEPLSPGYRARKPRNQDKVLILDAYMYDSYFYQVDGPSLLLGNPRVYAGAQHWGYPQHNLPARPHIGVSDDDVERLQGIAVEYLLNAALGRE